MSSEMQGAQLNACSLYRLVIRSPDPLLCLLHLLNMTVKQLTQSLPHVLISFNLETCENLDGLVFTVEVTQSSSNDLAFYR